MKLLRTCCLTAILLFTVLTCAAQESRIETEEQLLEEFEELWQSPLLKELTKSTRTKPFVFVRPKPLIIFSDDNGEKNFAITSPEEIIFYPKFFSFNYGKIRFEETSMAPHKVQRFIIGHELGHYLMGHASLSSKPNEGLLQYYPRRECEATVFSAQLIGGDSVDIVRTFEARYRQTKKEKALSLLLFPAFTVKGAISFLLHRRNNPYVSRFYNPLSKYGRRLEVHGPAFSRAVLVLEGKSESCNEY